LHARFNQPIAAGAVHSRARSDFTRDPGRRDQIIPQEDFTISNIEIVLHGSKVAPDVPIFGGHARNINALSVWSA
jgi:hypothetical protein